MSDLNVYHAIDSAFMWFLNKGTNAWSIFYLYIYLNIYFVNKLKYPYSLASWWNQSSITHYKHAKQVIIIDWYTCNRSKGQL